MWTESPERRDRRERLPSSGKRAVQETRSRKRQTCACDHRHGTQLLSRKVFPVKLDPMVETRRAERLRSDPPQRAKFAGISPTRSARSSLELRRHVAHNGSNPARASVPTPGKGRIENCTEMRVPSFRIAGTDNGSPAS